MKEQWQEVVGFSQYQVSDLGRVRSLSRIVVRGKGIKQPFVGKILKPATNKKTGYQHVTINGKSIYVHRLVAYAFLPNPKNLREVNHKDLDKTNNRKSNLEWKSSSANKKHAVLNGVRFNPKPKKGENNPVSKLSWKVVRLIRNLYVKKQHTQRELASKFGITQANVWFILNNKTWIE